MEQQMIQKLMTVEVKDLEDRVLELIGSTEGMDRDGEVIQASGWDLKSFKKNPVFLWAHDYRQPPIGKAVGVKVDGDKLMFKIQFADKDTYEFADTIYRLYKGGFLHATSVGFIPKEWTDGKEGDGPRRTYNKQELLELSAVPVPSNPEALSLALSKGVIDTKEFEAMNKPLTARSIGTAMAGAEDDAFLTGSLVDFVQVSDAVTASSADTTTATAGDYTIKWEDMPLVNFMLPDSQKMIKDELDYARQLVREADMDEEAEEIMKSIATDIIMRLSGSDIPVDILNKVGAVLSSKNKGNLKQAQDLIQSVLDSAEPPQESYEPGDISRLVAEAIRQNIRR